MGILKVRGRERVGENARSVWKWKGVSLGLVGVALLLVLAPAAQAATAGPSHLTIKAPYVGATGFPSSSTSSYGCALGTVTHAPFFHPTTGGVGFSVRAHASSCLPTYTDSGSSSAGESIGVPIPAYTGNNIIHAKWSIDAMLKTSLGSPSCTLTNASYSYCFASASADLYGYAYLYDATNGTYWYPDNSWAGASVGSEISAFCYLGNCTSTFIGSAHLALATVMDWTFHAHGLVASHAYVLQFSWYADASASDYTYLATISGAYESASVSMAGPGLGATLESITVR